jgi:hypothetical protein
MSRAVNRLREVFALLSCLACLSWLALFGVMILGAVIQICCHSHGGPAAMASCHSAGFVHDHAGSRPIIPGVAATWAA